MFSKNKPYLSADKLSKILNKSSRSIQRSLAKLRDDGFIKRIGLKRILGGYKLMNKDITLPCEDEIVKIDSSNYFYQREGESHVR